MELLLASEEQKRERDRVTFAAWGTRLTLEQYLERERRLRGHPWAREAMRTWLLCEGGAVLSSCETFRMRAFVQSGKGTPVEGVAQAIASIYTEPPLRGRQYASRMLALLNERLAREPGAKAATLYSDVGEPLYARVGYVARPAMDWVFSPEPGDPAEGVDALISEAGLEGALAAIPRPADPFVIWPTAGQLDWHLERERAYAELLGRPRPRACGARVGRSAIFWACAVKGELNVLLMHAEGAAEASALLRAARRTAAGAGAPGVRWWEAPLPFAWPLPRDEGRREPRDGSLPMLCPLDPAVRPGDWRSVSRALWV